VDSLKRGVQRVSYSDPFQGVWLNPIPEDSDHVAFEPTFIDRPEISVGIGLDYVTSVGAHVWTGIVDRRLASTHIEATALVELSEVRQELTASLRRTSKLFALTIHPTVRVSAAREQVRFYGENYEQLAGHEVDEIRALWGFERAMLWGGRYRWGVESHFWKGKREPALNAIGARSEFWWIRSDGSPIVTFDGNLNTRYARALLTANTVRHFKRRWTFIPSLRIGAGNNLPAQETFFLGGFAGFPGYRIYEARGVLENSISLLFKYHLGGGLFLTAETVGGGIFDEDPIRAKSQHFDYTEGGLTGRLVDGDRYGLELETLLGPIRFQLGHNTSGRQQATLTIGSWR
jgi:hypothetical protein